MNSESSAELTMKSESTQPRIELTLRGLVLGVVLTVIFTAANVYFGLKAGLTFSTSIPAVVISMAMLRWLGDNSAQENNIVQTVASTAGTLSSIVSALLLVLLRTWLFLGAVAHSFRLGADPRAPATGFVFQLSLALFGIGHLVGMCVGVAMFVGALIGWGWGVPHFSALHAAAGDAEVMAHNAWSHYVRYVGAGAIAVSAIWTLSRLVKPVIGGLKGAMASSRARKAGKGDTLARTEHDIPVDQVGLVSLLCILPICWLLWNFATSAGLGEHALLLTVGGIVIVVVLGVLVSTVCGYMAGLIRASHSPLS